MIYTAAANRATEHAPNFERIETEHAGRGFIAPGCGGGGEGEDYWAGDFTTDERRTGQELGMLQP